MEYVKIVAEVCSAGLELVGVSAITLLVLYSTFRAVVSLFRRGKRKEAFQEYRCDLARGILLGLEFLVASDIIYTVAIELTFSSVGVLAIVILIRTFLSFTLEVEMTGRWPWQKQSG